MTEKIKQWIPSLSFSFLSILLLTSCGFRSAHDVGVEVGSDAGAQAGGSTQTPQTDSLGLGQEAAGQPAAEEHDLPGEGGHTHRHGRWTAPPARYAGFRSDRWADPAAVSRGRKIYMQQCMACHGADGRGTGPAAQGLSHRPADLTQHSHRGSGDGDAYLFWRVSEGGTVEPFHSMESAMPAFKDILTEEERWDVLAYVHSYFHLGLAASQADDPVGSEEKKKQAHHHHHHRSVQADQR